LPPSAGGRKLGLQPLGGEHEARNQGRPLRAVTDFYEVVRRRLDEAECDQSEWEAIFDYLQALSEASAELMRKLKPERTQH
jgi:hypothetical protein